LIIQLFVLKTGSTMTASLNITGSNTKLTFGSRDQDDLVDLWGGTYGIGIKNLFINHRVPTRSGHKFYSGTTDTATINSTGNITATSFSENGANITNIPYSTITGKPRTFTADMTNICTKGEVNGIAAFANF
jgi:hypothetical protein